VTTTAPGGTVTDGSLLGLRALMPPASRTQLAPLAFALALIAAACSEPPAPTVDVGSGVRFLPEVADSLNDAGRHSSVVTNEAGLPVVAYFGFEEVPEEGEVVAPRPVGSPSLPGVFLATVSQEGYWTRGAIAIAEQIPNVNVAFNPAFDESVSRLKPENVTGLQLVADGDTYHAVWGSVAGIYYASGSLDPASSTQATAELVSSIPGLGPSIALVDGEPWIAFQTSTSPNSTVQLATPDGDRWDVVSIATEAPGCATCRTAIVAAPDGPVVAYADGAGVQLAVQDTENAWTSTNLGQGSGGHGLAGTATADGFAFSYYADDSVVVTTGSPESMTGIAMEVAPGSAEADGAATSVAVGEDGTVSVVWADVDEGVRFAMAGSVEDLEQDDAMIDTGAATEAGAFPSVVSNADPAVTYVSWYDTEQQDLLVGGYGDFEDVPFAAPSPVPTGETSQAEPPTSGDCAPVEGGTVTVVAEGIAFTEGECVAAPAGEPFTITFDNRDADTDHNIQIFGGAEPAGDTLFEGEIITGPAQMDYDVPALDPGEYAFNCVVHPTMTGSIRAGEGGGGTGATGVAGGATGATGGDGGGGGGGGAGTVTVTAANVQFDTSTIELPADEPSTILFTNEDAGVPHNIAIYEDESASTDLFIGDTITGPDEIEYAIDPLAAGEYYFRCDVHPDMNGTVVVS
jgi:plastocyanin